METVDLIYYPQIRKLYSQLRRTAKKILKGGIKMSEPIEILTDTMKAVKDGKIALDPAETIQDLGYTIASVMNAEDRQARRIGESDKLKNLLKSVERTKRMP